MKRRAFTLVELMVVLAVVALLLGMLLPGLRAIAAMARQTTCQSNLRQLSVAAFAYAATNSESMPPALLYFQEAGGVRTVAWDYELRGDTVAPGALARFTDAPSAVQQCPDFVAEPAADGDQAPSTEPFSGYNYNTSYIGHEGTYPAMDASGATLDGWRTARMGRPVAAFERPDRVALLGEGGWRGGANRFMRAPMNTVEGSMPVVCAGTQAFRHIGGCTCTVCLDGHVSVTDQPRRGVLTTDALARLVINFPANGFLSEDDAAYGGR